MFLGQRNRLGKSVNLSLDAILGFENIVLMTRFSVAH